MQEQALVIPIEKIKADFQTFLIPEYNRRIIFSGPFGIGKTYFLNEFFKEKKNDYFSIFLRPVNYSLLSNEDVFKFIKYDILIQLIDKQIIKIDRDLSVSRISLAKSFVLNNKLLILKNLLKVIPNLGGVAQGVDSFQELYKKYREGIDKADDIKSEIVENFKEDLENNFLLEYDRSSEFIKEKLQKAEGKKVLIIDDLDRLDPEHIFRLFNVFSAHFDQVQYYENKEGNDNKFGFDKIIFVCDIENIRKIFAHKYGAEVDFSGYIDKFYSTNVFHIYHQQIFENVVFPFLDRTMQMQIITHTRSGFKRDFKIMLKPLFEGKQISVRDLHRLSVLDPSFISEEQSFIQTPIALTKHGAQENTFLNLYSFLISLQIMLDIFESKETLIRKFKQAFLMYRFREDIDMSFEYNKLIPQILLFAGMDEHKFQSSYSGNGNPAEYVFENQSISMKYKVTSRHINTYREGEKLYEVNVDSIPKLNNGQFYNLLNSAIIKIFEKGILD